MTLPLLGFLDWAVAQACASALVLSISERPTRKHVAAVFIARRLFAQEDRRDNDQYGQYMRRRDCLVGSACFGF